MSLIDRGPDLRTIVTRRSLLPPPGDPRDARWTAAWEHLFQVYGPALRGYVRALLNRLPGGDPGEAEDVVQSYLAACLENGWLARDDGRIRCFRAWLQVQVRRYAISWVRRSTAAKRGGRAAGATVLPERVAEPRPRAAPDALSEGWVEVALTRALERLRRGNALYAAVIDDLRLGDGEPSADLGERLRQTPRQLTLVRHRARRRLSTLFAEELRATVRDEGAFEELWRTLEPFLP